MANTLIKFWSSPQSPTGYMGQYRTASGTYRDDPYTPTDIEKGITPIRSESEILADAAKSQIEFEQNQQKLLKEFYNRNVGILPIDSQQKIVDGIIIKEKNIADIVNAANQKFQVIGREPEKAYNEKPFFEYFGSLLIFIPLIIIFLVSLVRKK